MKDSKVSKNCYRSNHAKKKKILCKSLISVTFLLHGLSRQKNKNLSVDVRYELELCFGVAFELFKNFLVPHMKMIIDIIRRYYGDYVK